MAFPERVSASVLIDSVDVTQYIKPGSLNIDDKLSSQINTIKMFLENPPFEPREWQEVEFFSGATKLFGGYVITPEDQDGADVALDFNVSGSNYAIRLEKIKIKEQYENKTDSYIINDIFTKYLASEGFDGSTYVETFRTHPRIRFNRISILDVIKQLSEYAGAKWTVDVNKCLHFYEEETEVAPFSASDNPDLVSSFPYNGLKIKKDGAGVINRIEVIGGTYLSEDSTFYLTGNGVENRIIVPFKFHAPVGETAVQIWRNDGTLGTPVWTELTVKAGYIDALADPNDVLYYFNEKVIEQSAAFPNLSNAVKIIARYDVPLRVRVTDPVSYAFYGMYFDEVITRTDITAKETAKMLAKSKLAEKSFASEAISFNMDQPGVKAGQIIHVVNSMRSLDEDLIVQSVKSTIGINGRYTATIGVGTYNKDLIDALLYLNKKVTSTPEWRDDEVLDEILQTAEILPLAEVKAVTESDSPYYYSEDPAESFAWGFGMFTP